TDAHGQPSLHSVVTRPVVPSVTADPFAPVPSSRQPVAGAPGPSVSDPSPQTPLQHLGAPPPRAPTPLPQPAVTVSELTRQSGPMPFAPHGGLAAMPPGGDPNRGRSVTPPHGGLAQPFAPTQPAPPGAPPAQAPPARTPPPAAPSPP